MHDHLKKKKTLIEHWSKSLVMIKVESTKKKSLFKVKLTTLITDT